MQSVQEGEFENCESDVGDPQRASGLGDVGGELLKA